MSHTDIDPSPRPLVIEAGHPTEVDLAALREIDQPAVIRLDADGVSDLLMFRDMRGLDGAPLNVPQSQKLRLEHAFNISRGIATERMFRIIYGIFAPNAPIPEPGTTRSLLLTQQLMAPVLIHNGTFLPADAAKIHRAELADVPPGPVVALFDRHQATRSDSAHAKMNRADQLRAEIDLVFNALGISNTQGTVFC